MSRPSNRAGTALLQNLADLSNSGAGKVKLTGYEVSNPGRSDFDFILL